MDDRDENLPVRSSFVRRPMAFGARGRSVLLHLQPLSSHHLYGDRDNNDGLKRARLPASTTHARTDTTRISPHALATAQSDTTGASAAAYPRQGRGKRGVLRC